MKEKLSTVFIAASINLILFITIAACFNPIYNTNEDVYILYLLSGGFGTPPTELLHYNYEMHPYLNLFIKNLFVLSPDVNWYSVVLLLCHYVASCIILFEIIKRGRNIYAILCYSSLFIIFEAKFLLNTNHTNTAIILTCSAFILLFTGNTKTRRGITAIVAAIMIVLLASFFRLLVIIPLAGMSLPFLVSKAPGAKLAVLTTTLLTTAILIILFNQLHQSYYRAASPSWQQEENYRQLIYSFYNHHRLNQPTITDQEWDTEINILTHGSPIDTNFISSYKLVEMRKDLLNKKVYTVNSTNKKNWFWINNRIYFLVILLFLLLSLQSKKLFLVASISFILIVTGLYILSVHAKSPEYLKISTLYLFTLFVLLSLQEVNLVTSFPLIASGMLLLLIVGCIQLYKLNKKNTRGIQQFRLSSSEIINHKGKLFVLTADNFPLQNFYIFDVPRKFQLPNFLGGEHFLQNIYQPAFERFRINAIKELPLNQNVLFWGERAPAFENYLRLTTGRGIMVSDVIDGFKYGEVRAITFENQEKENLK